MISQSDLYHAKGATAGCESLNQLAAFSWGTWSDANSDDIPDTISRPSRSQSWTPDGQGNFTTVTTNGVGCFLSRSGVPPLGLVWPGLGHWPNRTVFPGSREVTREPIAKAKRRDAASTEDPTATISSPSRSQSWTPGGQGNFTPVTTNGTGEARTYDKQNQVTALIDASGNVVERYVYDPYGKVTILSPDGSTVRTSSNHVWAYLHQGGRQDTATGLLNFRNRDYSTSLMRWTTNDPIGIAGGDTNTYRYVGNGPGNGLDPSGLQERQSVNGGNAIGGFGNLGGGHSPGGISLKPGPNPNGGFGGLGGQGGSYHPTKEEIELKKKEIDSWNWYVASKLKPNVPGVGYGYYHRSSIFLDFKEQNDLTDNDISKISDEIYTAMKEFDTFNHENIADVLEPKKINGRVLTGFATHGITGSMAALTSGDGPEHRAWVELTFDDKRRKISARTLGNHMLVGTRVWQVERIDGGIMISTSTIDKRSSYANNIGFILPHPYYSFIHGDSCGPSMTIEVWERYLKN